MGYIAATLYTVVLVSLDNIQEHLENPFDDVGMDDIDLREDMMVAEVLARGAGGSSRPELEAAG